MMKYDKTTLDHFRNILNDEEGYGASAMDYVFDTMSDHGIPDFRASNIQVQIQNLITDLLPEIVDWLERRAQENPSEDFHLTYIDDVKSLVIKDQIRTLVPFFVRILNKNKRTVLKQILYAVKNQFNWDASQRKLLLDQINFMQQLGINWPELDTILKGLTK